VERLQYFGYNTVRGRQQGRFMWLFLNRFLNPLVLILVCAASIVVVLHDLFGATIMLAIIFISKVLSFAGIALVYFLPEGIAGTSFLLAVLHILSASTLPCSWFLS